MDAADHWWYSEENVMKLSFMTFMHATKIIHRLKFKPSKKIAEVL